jgi:hypothetical protein
MEEPMQRIIVGGPEPSDDDDFWVAIHMGEVIGPNFAAEVCRLHPFAVIFPWGNVFEHDYEFIGFHEAVVRYFKKHHRDWREVSMPMVEAGELRERHLPELMNISTIFFPNDCYVTVLFEHQEHATAFRAFLEVMV